ncbi:MAG: VPDSG-CTERM sorting domain-containing protein [Chthoniobacterales bacterium]|nr:VPDSG-CTERM sorting domain-containing protein [Chthoniobacterales bacterium]
MKPLKFSLAILSVGFAMMALTGNQTEAAMINGAITFAGGAVYDTNSLATATRVNAFSDVNVKSCDGDFAGFVSVGDTVTMATPYIFSPSTPTPGLWSVGGFTYDLASSTVVFQNANFLLIQGTGTVMGNGFDATPGSWSFTSQSPSANGVFSFSASTAAQGVPDGGTTVALLGFALAGVEILRRKLASA